MEINDKTITHEDYENVTKDMTLKEVCDILDMIESAYVPDYNFTYTDTDLYYFKLHEALEKAEQCVEKYSIDGGYIV